MSDDVRIRHADGSETILSGKPSVIAQARRDYLNGCIDLAEFERRAGEHFQAAAQQMGNGRLIADEDIAAGDAVQINPANGHVRRAR